MEKMLEITCPDCGKIIPADAPMGMCPVCLLRLGLAPRRIGKYELRKLKGEGGGGAVWEARDTDTNGIVALKMLRENLWVDECARIRFKREATTRLDHRHIVPILDVDKEEYLYFIMKWMSGGNLAEKLFSYRADPERAKLDPYRGDPDKRATHLVEKIAQAVHHAHYHGILHRDLKPANILLDEEGQPHVADFGAAKFFYKTLSISRTGAVVGTPHYMAPEQEAAVMETDVYALGVILYELITGQRPFEGDTLDQILEKIKNDAPKDPQKVEPRVDRNLAALCLKCLDKVPEHRYNSAQELAQALYLHRIGELPTIKPPGPAKRAWWWYRRHPKTTALLIAGVIFLLILTPNVVLLAHDQNAVERARTTQVNMNSAAMVAGTVLSQLRALSDAVERAASQNDLAQALENGDDAALQAFCMSAYRFYEDPSHGLKLNQSSPFYFWIIYDEKATLRAVSPAANVVLGRNYEWRNYFKGAWDLAGKGRASTYVSRAYKGERDGKYKFAISAPIFGAKRRPIGVLAASVPTAANLGSLVVRDPQSVTALVAPRDRERDTLVPASTHLILLHPAYSSGEAIPIENAHVRKLDNASRDASLRIERPLGLPRPDLVTWTDDYEDPVAIKYPQYAGRWLAGFAPVGNTGFVVIVQTREDPPFRIEWKQVAKWAGVAACPGVLLVLLAFWYERRQARRARAYAQGRRNIRGPM